MELSFIIEYLAFVPVLKELLSSCKADLWLFEQHLQDIFNLLTIYKNKYTLEKMEAEARLRPSLPN